MEGGQRHTICEQDGDLDVALFAGLTDRLAAGGIPAIILIAVDTDLGVSPGSAADCQSNPWS